MADAVKRPNNNADKSTIATSKAPNISAEQALSTALGARVRVQTTNSNIQTLDGILFTACPKTSLLAISIGPLAAPTHHIIPLWSLTAFTVLALPSTTQQVASLGPVNAMMLLDRAEKALARAKDKAAKTNQSVGRDAQEVFYALSKQYATVWLGKDIVVMDRVVVKGPGYRGEDCTAYEKDREDRGTLERVIKIVENERKRTLQRDSGKTAKPAIPNIVPAVPAPQGARKGG